MIIIKKLFFLNDATQYHIIIISDYDEQSQITYWLTKSVRQSTWILHYQRLSPAYSPWILINSTRCGLSHVLLSIFSTKITEPSLFVDRIFFWFFQRRSFLRNFSLVLCSFRLIIFFNNLFLRKTPFELIILRRSLIFVEIFWWRKLLISSKASCSCDSFKCSLMRLWKEADCQTDSFFVFIVACIACRKSVIRFPIYNFE